MQDLTTDKAFWSRISIPINEDWAENGADFVNPIQVADMFAEATTIAAQLGAQAESLIDQMQDIEEEKDALDLKISRLRRLIISDNYSSVKSNVQGEIKEAFVLAMADADQRADLLQLEREIDSLAAKLRSLKPRLERVERRMKATDKNMEYAKQFLDFDKLMKRITQNNGRF